MGRGKEVAGRRAAAEVQDGMTIGLGTGSTVDYTLIALGERIRDEGLHIRGVPTSVRTEQRARELGIPLASLSEVTELALTIDGADEVDPAFRLVKGGGGALLREKVVASITRRQVTVVGANKLVERLADAFPLPVEVVPFARPVVERRLRDLGGDPVLRMAENNEYRTDNGNGILDTRFPGGLEDPEAMERALAGIPGIVESGLFIGLCKMVVIGWPDGRLEVRRHGEPI